MINNKRIINKNKYHLEIERKGFTLLELIITVTILAVLIGIVVVAINPAEQLARARDAKRVADLDAIKSAIILYTATATSTVNLDGNGTANSTCANGSGTDTWYVNTIAGVLAPPGSFATATSTTQTIGTAGWLKARLDQTPGGSPLANLPLDPTNGAGSGTTYYYSYACDVNDKTFELTARLESTYFRTDIDTDGTDGGNSTSTYESGTKLTILPDLF